jgi:hypothetical protein
MSYQQQPGNWGDQSWPSQQPYADPAAPTSPYTDPYASYAPASGQPAGYGPGYAYPGYAPPAAPGQVTNGMAVAAMVLSIVGAPLVICYGAGAVLTRRPGDLHQRAGGRDPRARGAPADPRAR